MLRFLFAQLHLDSLIDKTTPNKITRALKELPKGLKSLDRAYEKAIERIESQEPGFRHLAERVLLWITFSKRPLTSLELRHALAIEVGDSTLDEGNLEEIEEIISVCAGLVTVEEGNVACLIHYTTQQFLEFWPNTKHGIPGPNPQGHITMTCITYLTFDTFQSGFCLTDEEFERRLQENVFYDYAAENWGHHARQASTEVEQLILNFLQCGAQLSACSQALIASKEHLGDSNYSQDVPRNMTGLHVAAFFELSESMITLVKTGQNLDLKDSYGQTPLLWAARCGHEVVVKLLLEESAKIDSKDNKGRTPLTRAAMCGGEVVVSLLLEEGAEIESKDCDGMTPLSWAACYGQEAVVKLLLKKGAKVESRSYYYR